MNMYGPANAWSGGQTQQNRSASNNTRRGGSGGRGRGGGRQWRTTEHQVLFPPVAIPLERATSENRTPHCDFFSDISAKGGIPISMYTFSHAV